MGTRRAGFSPWPSRAPTVPSGSWRWPPGLRRGELLGLRWRDVDLDRRTLSIRQTVGLVGTTVVAGQPKTRSGRRTIPVPADVIETLREHRRRQNERRLALGSIWQDHDLVFAATNGNPINPNNLRRN